MSNYKKFVEEYKINYKLFGNNIKDFSYPRTYASFSLSIPMYHSSKYYSMYMSNREPTEKKYTSEPSENDYTSEPTEKKYTIKPSNLYTKCPSIIVNESFNPTVYKDIQNINVENKNNNVLIISICIVSFSLCFFVTFYKFCYLKYKKKLERRKKDDLDLNFGLSYVDDF
jgi:hypothetical protein